MLNLYYKNTEETINYNHSKVFNPPPADFHLHNRFEIYFFIAGNVNYFIEKKVYHLKYGDLLIMNSHEIHKPSFPLGGLYERIVIHFEPSIPRLFGSPGFDPLNCFVNRPKGENNKLNLSKLQIEEMFKLLYRIENLGECGDSGSELLKLAYFIELLVYINKIFLSKKPEEENPNIPEKLIPILDYIDRNLESDLTLGSLSRKFYLDGSYLSRLFKNSIGNNLHEYIIFKRISRAKKLLSDGYSVTEACAVSGFNDYSHFLRTFKRTVGIPPGQYRKSSL